MTGIAGCIRLRRRRGKTDIGWPGKEVEEARMRAADGEWDKEVEEVRMRTAVDGWDKEVKEARMRAADGGWDKEVEGARMRTVVDGWDKETALQDVMMMRYIIVRTWTSGRGRYWTRVERYF
jgi:hypothetical protein